jgi:Endonuclease NucS
MKFLREASMDAILFSANQNRTSIDDAIRHLADHKELYWSMPLAIKQQFNFPIYGLIHLTGEQVEYRATISDILPFSPDHFDPSVKPEAWRKNPKEYKSSIVITEIAPFSYPTLSLKKPDGTDVRAAPEGGYTRIVLPDIEQKPAPLNARELPSGLPQPTRAEKRPLDEKNLENFIVQQLEMIEPGLRLVERQLSTPAGRLDLLCRDAQGSYVVVELKRTQGSDQVVGQISRYIGWLKESHPGDRVRGIVVVGKKDQALSYAAKAVADLEVKEFKILIQ